jgi:hypothetical protein
MELINVVAIVAIAGGGLYLLLAIFGAMSAPNEEAVEPSSNVMLAMESDGVLVHAEATDARMRKIAAIGAGIAGRVFHEAFDFTPESIARLDRAIVAGWGSASDGSVSEVPTMEAPSAEVILSFGAYLGEVLVRRTKGRWVTGLSDDDPANVLFLGALDETVAVSPFLLVAEKFSNMYGFDLSVAFTALEQKLKELNVA